MKLFGRKKTKPSSTLPVLQTARLVLRAFDPSDAVEVFAQTQSESVGPMSGWAPHPPSEDGRREVETFIRECEPWAVVEKKSGRVIGAVGLNRDVKRRVEGALELGYALHEKYWGQGYATEACGAVLAYAFDELDCPVVCVGHLPSNQRSRRVIKKLGFSCEGTLRCARSLPGGERADEVCYSLLKEEYEAKS